MNILLLSNSVLFQAIVFAKALDKYFDTVEVINANSDTYNYNGEEHEFAISAHDYDKYLLKRPQDFCFDLSRYDIVFGLDQNCLPILAEIKNKMFANQKVGVHILDYPDHVFTSNKNYNDSVKARWPYFMRVLPSMDFVFHNQSISMEKTKLPSHTYYSKFVRYPVNPIRCNAQQKDFIVYSGRLVPDKGIHFIIDALGLLKEDIELVTIGSGFDFTDYAKFMKVNYRNVKCDELEKWKLYAQSCFLVCGADNENIPSLCILEGISIGKTGIVFDYPENRLHYGDNAFYCRPHHIGDFANLIQKLWNKEASADKDRAINYYHQYCTYDVWAKEVYDGIMKSYE